ncbi:MAG: nuclear transport factor 2 family protein [Rhodospirillaceae bacterium]|nr:MAG: nuclear transport factor 2 family protein [Rhodospirillaceae bacterium]
MSTAEENTKIVKKAAAALLSGDFEGFFADFAEDVEIHEPASLPYGGIYKGLAEAKRCTLAVFSSFENASVQVVEHIASNDSVILHAILSGVGRKTGKPFSVPVMEKYQFENGKIKMLQPFYFDTAYLREVIG